MMPTSFFHTALPAFCSSRHSRFYRVSGLLARSSWPGITGQNQLSRSAGEETNVRPPPTMTERRCTALTSLPPRRLLYFLSFTRPWQDLKHSDDSLHAAGRKPINCRTRDSSAQESESEYNNLANSNFVQVCERQSQHDFEPQATFRPDLLSIA
jgi:hypothetical protein